MYLFQCFGSSGDQFENILKRHIVSDRITIENSSKCVPPSPARKRNLGVTGSMSPARRWFVYNSSHLFDFLYLKKKRQNYGTFWINNYDEALKDLQARRLNKDVDYIDPILIADVEDRV